MLWQSKRRAAIILALPLLLSSCFFDGVTEADIDKIRENSLFLNIPNTATELHDNFMSWQSDREFISFRDSQQNVDKFIKNNITNLHEGGFRYFPKHDESWWVSNEGGVTRKLYYTKDFTFLYILVKDEPGSSTIWALEMAGN